MAGAQVLRNVVGNIGNPPAVVGQDRIEDMVADPRPVLLEVRNLKTHFKLRQGVVRSVDGVDLTICRGQTLGVPSRCTSASPSSCRCWAGPGWHAPCAASSWHCALLSGVQNIRAVALAPWLFLPGLAIVVTVLAFNFVGDGLRAAADPYSQ